MVKRTLLRPLVCGSCGAQVEGDSLSEVFVCYTCSLAHYMASEEIQTFPFRALKPLNPMSTMKIHAPFWFVKGRYRIHTRSNHQTQIYRRIKPLEHIMVPAFWSPLTDVIKTISFTYARLSEDQLVFEEKKVPVFKATRDPSILKEIVTLLWLGYLDRAVDVTGVTVSATLEEVLFVTVPFHRDAGGKRWWDSLTGENYPSNLFV